MISTDETLSRKTKRERVAENRERADIIRETLNAHTSLLKIAVDCSFGDIMSDQERSSLSVQLQECYSHLRRYGEGKCQMFVGSVNSDLQAALDRKGASNWAVHFHTEDVELMSADLGYNLIVMSPDASEELSVEDVQDTSNMFVIGGIVDKVVSKNETAHKAIRMGARSRRLPMDPGLMRNRILNIDTVFMFLLRCFNASSNMSRDRMIALLLELLPIRKKALEIKPISSKQRDPEKQPFTDPSNTTKLENYKVLDLFS